MNREKQTLYLKDNTGNIRWWEIQADYVNKELRISHGVIGGAVQHQFESVEEGKVNRSVDEQIQLRMNSRISRKMDKGYVADIEQAKSGRPKNILGYPKPMLAQKFKTDQYIDLSKAMVQYKYNGHRCLITNDDGIMVAYTRNGRLVKSISHIIDEIKIPEGDILDGELYAHGMSIQAISSLIKKPQPGSSLLRFHCYDMVSRLDFSERFEIVKSLSLGKYAEAVPTWSAADDDINHENIFSKTAKAKELGYEGLMLRFNDGGYKDGHRPKQLVKVKLLMDDEFKVKGVETSKDDWAILVCELPNGKTFNVAAPGTMPEKQRVLDEREKYIGRWLNVEFAEYTADGKPFHPVANYWRDMHKE